MQYRKQTSHYLPTGRKGVGEGWEGETGRGPRTAAAHQCAPMIEHTDKEMGKELF